VTSGGDRVRQSGGRCLVHHWCFCICVVTHAYAGFHLCAKRSSHADMTPSCDMTRLCVQCDSCM